jgi:lipoyl(octanoyl) transferase
MDLVVEWLGRMAYREAWARQRQAVAARALGSVPDTLLLVEHEAVLTLGRHASETHVIAAPGELAQRGIEVIRVERGGEVTYHGPGQLVAYPIVRLADRGILLRPFVRALELSMVDVAASYGVLAAPRPGYPGAWVEADGAAPRKIGALGLRLERGVTYHGIAFNLDPRLEDFGLIEPCGMAGLDVTSIARELDRQGARDRQGAHVDPGSLTVEEAGRRFADAFRRRLHEAASESATRATARPGAPATQPAPSMVHLSSRA